jgi:hypothetical protein
MSTEPLRFADGGSPRFLWAGPEVLVVCPRCGRQASVRTCDGVQGPGSWRLTCSQCGLTKEQNQQRACAGQVDPWFGRPSWLVGEYRGHRIWAYNRRHLGQMRRYVAASLRERGRGPRGGMSMIATLPRWMKHARNRAGLLREFDRMAARLEVSTSS